MISLKKIFVRVSVFVVLLCGWIGYTQYPIWRDYLGGPPVRFMEDDRVALGLYPEGYRSAFVFTNDDYRPVTPPADVEKLQDRLKGLGIRGTFFIVPYFLREHHLDAVQANVAQLKKLQEDGHEIAQHGYRHYCERNQDRGVRMSAEMAFLSEMEQEDRISKGRNILSDLGFSPVGHRSPCFYTTEETLIVLDRLGFLYGSDFNLPATTPRSLLVPSFRGRIMFPYHPDGLRLLQVTSQTDPTYKLSKVKKIFQRFRRWGGVVVILTHFPDLSEEKNLDRLESFLKYVRSHNDVWVCPLEELCRWWLVREVIEVDTSREADTVIIRCENPTSSHLVNACFTILDGSRYYRISTSKGKILWEGAVPDSGRVIVNIPPTRYSSS